MQSRSDVEGSSVGRRHNERRSKNCRSRSRSPYSRASSPRRSSRRTQSEAHTKHVKSEAKGDASCMSGKLFKSEVKNVKYESSLEDKNSIRAQKLYGEHPSACSRGDTAREARNTSDDISRSEPQGVTYGAQSEAVEVPEPEKPNFEPSGILSEETNMKNGVLLKYSEPSDARCPTDRWRIYVFKGTNADKESKILYLHRHSCYIVGKEPRIAEVLLVHPTVSKQHAVIQFRLHPSKRVVPYLIDLESTNGSFLNGERIEPSRYYELRHGDSLRFGCSSRDLVLTNEAEAQIEKVSYAEYVHREIESKQQLKSS